MQPLTAYAFTDLHTHTFDGVRAALLAGTTKAERRSSSVVVYAATLMWSLRQRYAGGGTTRAPARTATDTDVPRRRGSDE